MAEKRAILTYLEDPQGSPQPVFLDAETGEPVTDFTDYTLDTQPSEDEIDEVSSKNPEISEEKELQRGRGGRTSGLGGSVASRTASDNFGYRSKPLGVKAASFVPGPIGMIGKALNLGWNANNVAGVNAARQYIGLDPLSNTQTLKETIIGPKTDVTKGKEKLSVNEKQYDVSIGGVKEKGLFKKDTTALTPQEARTRQDYAQAKIGQPATQGEITPVADPVADEDISVITGIPVDTIQATKISPEAPTALNTGEEISPLGPEAITAESEQEAIKALDDVASQKIQPEVTTETLSPLSDSPTVGVSKSKGINPLGIGSPQTTPLGAAPAPTGLTGVGRFNSKVDNRLYGALDEAAMAFSEKNPGYSVEAFSGYRPGDKRQHGKQKAVDVQIKDPYGNVIDNYQNAEAFRTYEKFAQDFKDVVDKKYPELAESVRWGGYFSGKPGIYGAADLMHFDINDDVGMLGGSWAQGLTEAQKANFPGAESMGMASGPYSAPTPTSRPQTGKPSKGFTPSVNAVESTLGDLETSVFSPPDDIDSLPAGMKNNNPGNLKYNPEVAWDGLVGPSENLDEGDPQAVFSTPEKGMRAAAKLSLNKYNEGLTTPRSMITDQKGWTPGYAPAAQNIANMLGIGLDDDLDLSNPVAHAAFLGALVSQEQGPDAKRYSKQMIDNAIVEAKEPTDLTTPGQVSVKSKTTPSTPNTASLEDYAKNFYTPSETPVSAPNTNAGLTPVGQTTGFMSPTVAQSLSETKPGLGLDTSETQSDLGTPSTQTSDSTTDSPDADSASSESGKSESLGGFGLGGLGSSSKDSADADSDKDKSDDSESSSGGFGFGGLF